MKVAIVGTGAVGGFVGGAAADAGEDITLLDPWDQNVEAIRSNGILVDDPVAGPRHFHPRKVMSINEIGTLQASFDLLLVAVKSYNTEMAVTKMIPYLTEDSIVVSVQNSINEEIIMPIVGRSRTVGVVVRGNCQMMQPAKILITRSITQSDNTGVGGVNYLVGELDGKITKRAERIAQVLSHANKATVTSNLWGERWSKLIINCVANSVCGATGLRSSEVWTNPALRKVSSQLAYETVDVGNRLGYPIPSVMGDLSVDDILGVPKGESVKLDQALLQRSQKVHELAMPSLLQDILKERRTEIDYLNGLVVNKGNEAGVATETSQAIVNLIHTIEQGQAKPNPDAVAQLAMQ